MKDTMGVIYTSQNDLSLRELTVSRSVAALPVAGRYRLIDFTLSNLVNSGVRNVGIIMQRNYHSLMDHIGSGMEWDLHTRTDGLHILPPFLTRENVGTYEGILDALYSNISYLTRSTQTYVILTSSRTALNVTFDDMLRFHEESGNDITLMYSPKNHDEVDNTPTLTPRYVYMDVDGEGHVRDIEIGPSAPSSNNFYIEVMLLKRSLLLQMIDQAHAHSMHDLNRDFLQRYIRSGLFRVGGYCFKGYNRRIATINSYYRFNMDLLNSDVRRELFNVNPVYTKVRDEMPAHYLSGSSAKNSLLADGCVIEGTVENSILFRGVHVGPGAVVRGAILMQGDDIGAGAEVENVILDKNVIVKPGSRLITPSTYPIVIGKGQTI